MARSTPQSNQYNRSSSAPSRHSRQSSSSSMQTPENNVGTSGSAGVDGAGNQSGEGDNNKKMSSTSIISSLLLFPLVLIHMLYSLLKLPFSGLLSFATARSSSRRELSDGEDEEQSNVVSVDPPTVTDNDDPDVIRAELAKHAEDNDYLCVAASPALTTLLDDALYKAYQAELLPTVAAASQLLAEFIEMKEASALILRECRWMVGVPMGGGTNIQKWNGSGRSLGTADGDGGFEGVVVDGNGIPMTRANRALRRRSSSSLDSASGSSNTTTNAKAERLHSEEILRWNEFDTIQDFAQQCYLGANEAIQRLTTDRLAESANLTLQDSMAAFGNNEGEKNNGPNENGNLQQSQGGSSSSSSAAQASISTFLSPADAGIGRCYHPQPRRDTWESPRLYCPDYYWADDAIGGCQRLLKTLSKHRFVNLSSDHGWERYAAIASAVRAPTYASCTPHVFPSLEAAHALQHLTSQLLPRSVPSSLNKFRAAVESNAVVSKRLYLVKCEYRAPMRALWESYQNLNSAPKGEVVERYLREYHGVKTGENNNKGGGSGSASASGGSSNSSESSGVKTSGLRRKGSTEVLKKADVAKKSAIQMQREKLETLIREKYWKHPAFLEALQLERCCEQMEIEMSQMLLPLSNLAAEIMNEWKGRLRAVAVVNYPLHDEEENKDDDGDDDSSDDDENIADPIRVLLGWQDVPYMRELLRRLKSILRRKPDLDESTGIRPLLLDLQGVPRHKQDPIDSSIEMSFYPPLTGKQSLFERFTSEKTGEVSPDDEWFHLEQFLLEVHKLLELLTLPNIPCLVEERIAGSKGDKLLDLIEQCNEVWDEEMFRAQYQDWYDMVKRQQELNAGTAADSTVNNKRDEEKVPQTTTLSELSETIREAEIELSIAMASKDQLERVHKRLEALRGDKKARYKVLRHIVFDLGYRELNDGIVVEPPLDDATVEFPRLSDPGVFGDQLILSGEVLPVG